MEAYMITINCLGQLGNSMFCIAAGVAHAKRLGTTYQISDFMYSESFIGPFNIIPNGMGARTYKEPGFHYTPLPKVFDMTLVASYFQSERYFEDQGHVIRSLFQPEKKIREYINENNFQRYLNATAIHVRRTDYLRLSDYHYNLELEYYTKAIRHIEEIEPESKFIVFSDDIDWCKEHFDNVEFCSHEDPVIDLLIMSKCKNHIIANSSFSWWAAYLGRSPDQTVIAPRRWFGPKKEHLITSDLYCDNWKILDYA